MTQPTDDTIDQETTVPRVIGVEATCKGDRPCDFVVIAVPDGQEDAWVEAAELWGYSLSARERGPGLIAVLVPRSNPYSAVNGEHVLEGIRQQRTINRTPPPDARKPKPQRD